MDDLPKRPHLTLVDPASTVSEHDLEFAPLPHFNWDRRPDGHPLDAEEAATALHLANGEVCEASRLLKVPAYRLHRLLKASPRLQRVRDEALAIVAYRAEAVPIATLFDPNADARRLEWASSQVLKSGIGRASPLAPAALTSLSADLPDDRVITIHWGHAPAGINSTDGGDQENGG